MSDFTKKIKSFIFDSTELIQYIQTNTIGYVKPAIELLQKKHPSEFAKYNTHVIIDLAAAIDNLKKLHNTESFELATLLYLFEVLYSAESAADYIIYLLNNTVTSTAIISDMSETFVNDVYANRTKIIEYIEKLKALIGNSIIWNLIAANYPAFPVRDITNINRFVIFLIKRNYAKMPAADQKYINEIIDKQKESALLMPAVDYKKLFENTAVLNKIICTYHMVPSLLAPITDVLSAYGLKNIPELADIAEVKKFLDGCDLPFIVVFAVTGKPIEFALRKLLVADNIQPIAGISEAVIEKFKTIYDIPEPAPGFANEIFGNISAHKNTKDQFHIIESQNGITYRALSLGGSLAIPYDIGFHVLYGVELSHQYYNNIMESVITRVGTDPRAAIILAEYELNKKVLPNLDFIKTNIIKDLVNAFIEKFNESEVRGGKSAKKSFISITSKHLPKSLYDNFVTSIFHESRNTESNITLLIKISAIITKFNRNFVAAVDKLDINEKIFSNDFKDVRYQCVGYYKDLLWNTMRVVDSGNGLFKNIELSLKEYYISSLS